MNELELILMFAAGILVGMFISYLKNLRKISKMIDAALAVVDEKGYSIQSMHEKTGWFDCLDFLIKFYR